MVGSTLRRLLAPLGMVLALFSGAAAARAPEPAQPALWAVSDDDTTIYLFGTIHLLPKGTAWRGKALNDAMAQSDDLVIETIVDDKNPAQFMAAMNSLARSPNLPPLRERVAPDKRAKVDAAVKATGIPAPFFDTLETWAAGFLLLSGQFRDIGLEGGEGVEMVLRKAFAQQNKPIDALESNIEQLGYFDRLSEKAQRSFLEGIIDGKGDLKASFNAMLDVWSRGDVAGIARTFDKDLSESPELKDALMVQRNRQWKGWVQKRLEKPGSTLLAVGAGHLAGGDSLIAMLEKDGYKVRRLR